MVLHTYKVESQWHEGDEQREDAEPEHADKRNHSAEAKHAAILIE